MLHSTIQTTSYTVYIYRSFAAFNQFAALRHPNDVVHGIRIIIISELRCVQSVRCTPPFAAFNHLAAVYHSNVVHGIYTRNLLRLCAGGRNSAEHRDTLPRAGDDDDEMDENDRARFSLFLLSR